MAAENPSPLYSVTCENKPVVKEPIIPGGYILTARKVDDSDIAHTAPCIRETWLWLLRQCNHKPSGNIKRGQCVRTLSDIQEGLHWFVGYRKMMYSKTQCENAMNTLRKMEMITTAKTTRGLIITVCNYETYQNPKNYEDNSEGNKKTTRRQQCGDTINKNDKNVKNVISSAEAAQTKPFKEWNGKEFINEIEKFKDKFSYDVRNDFFKYWKEKSATGKMRFQLEKTWETELRLEYWVRRADKVENKKTGKSVNEYLEQRKKDEERFNSKLNKS